MLDFIFAGGPAFTVPLTLLAVAVLLLAGRKALDLFVNTDQPPAALRRGLDAILHLGIFSFFLGLLGQAVGLYHMFQAIEAAGDISPGLVYGGLKVSLITTLYGLTVLLGAAVLWFVLRHRYQALVDEE